MPAQESTIKRAQNGDKQAVALLYEQHVDQIYRYIVYRVTDRVDAEDLTAEVFVKMVEGLPSYRYTGVPFEVWLYRIASARVIDFRRRLNRRPQTELHEMYSDDRPNPEEKLQEVEEIAVLREALGQLTEEQQNVLVLRFLERKSHIEVADVIGKSESAVKSIQHRALIRLAGLLGSDEKVRHYLRGE